MGENAFQNHDGKKRKILVTSISYLVPPCFPFFTDTVHEPSPISIGNQHVFLSLNKSNIVHLDKEVKMWHFPDWQQSLQVSIHFFLIHETILNLFLSQKTNFRLFQTERVCRRQRQIWSKWKKTFFKRVENTVGKGEIGRYEQFLLFPRCFQKICTADT